MISPQKNEATATPRRAARVGALGLMRRTVIFYVLWLGLAGAGIADLIIGLFAAFAASWTSFLLIPQSPARFSPLASMRLLFRFAGQSFLAGIYTARRAMDLNIAPGFITYHTNLPAGPARNMFTTIECLFPGSMPVEERRDGTLVLHCLDVNRPSASGMARDEALLRRAGGVGTPP
ncbi:sodium:proton antiporter [Aureimonas fodinaquatilis]|uniref:Sodium:proton antiporter n=1 Tax=Aureimonas fodinaquatilis TaxID=2565783 RepID=A0A5B0E1C6_9HYPH|nr:Na+/H+ antiporter subunit E [Aureimonas fodinaquatilis]KAA0971925.1 sodium:proton antiporter [Aureimonas fodinaquatilis]